MGGSKSQRSTTMLDLLKARICICCVEAMTMSIWSVQCMVYQRRKVEWNGIVASPNETKNLQFISNRMQPQWHFDFYRLFGGCEDLIQQCRHHTKLPSPSPRLSTCLPALLAALSTIPVPSIRLLPCPRGVFYLANSLDVILT